MRKEHTTPHEEGFVLITTLLVMLVLTIIGIAANTNTSIELQIAGNDKAHKKTFYAAEAGAILGTEVLEQNINCPTGFSAGSSPLEGKIMVPNLIFAHQDPPEVDITSIVDNDDKADVFFYKDDIANGDPGTYLYIWGSTNIAAGGSLVMVSGYEYLGKSSAGGGVYILFDIYSKHLGQINSESIILFGWRHMVGMESTCYY